MKFSFNSHITLTALSAVIALGGFAKDIRSEMIANPDKCGGVYYAYPIASDSIVKTTAAPKGYKPFYISHYGRHGSRYLISDNDYKNLLDKMQAADAAGALTPFGKDVTRRLERVWDEANGRGGELSPLGARQHHAIASRMFENYPEVFVDTADITAVSSQVMRCAHSMFAFVEALKEKNQSLNIPRESGQRHMDYLCYWTPESGDFNSSKGTWRPDYLNFKASHTDGKRLVDALFADKKYAGEHIVPDELIWEFYWVTVGQQNIENDDTFTDVLTPDELYNLWQVFNLQFYMRNAGYARSKGVHANNAKKLLSHIVDNADKYIASGKTGATLRFGHDGNITHLLTLMQLENCAGVTSNPNQVKEVWNDFYVSPMAANLQLIFFRNEKNPDDILVKILHNEKETSVPVPTTKAPFYKWNDLRSYFKTMIERPFAETINARNID